MQRMNDSLLIAADSCSVRRFAPVSSSADVTLYWIRTNAEGSDNAAIGNTPLDTQYR